MHGTDHARAGEKSPKHRQQECRKDERHVPDFQHAAFLLHHDGVQKRGAGQPWHERSIFHRIPSPVAAPAENGIGPVRAEENADGQEAPGHHGPAAGDVDPFFAGIFHDERAQREREWHGEADVSQIQHGRVNDHFGILQKRIQSGAIGGKRALHDAERARGEIQNQQKENLHRGDDHRSISKQALIGLIAQAKHKSIAGEQQRPEQQRAFLSRPQHGKLIGERQFAIAVMKNVCDGEVVVEGGSNQNDARQ